MNSNLIRLAVVFALSLTAFACGGESPEELAEYDTAQLALYSAPGKGSTTTPTGKTCTPMLDPNHCGTEKIIRTTIGSLGICEYGNGNTTSLYSVGCSGSGGEFVP